MRPYGTLCEKCGLELVIRSTANWSCILASFPGQSLAALEKNGKRPGTIITSQTRNGGLGFVMMATCPCNMWPVQPVQLSCKVCLDGADVLPTASNFASAKSLMNHVQT